MALERIEESMKALEDVNKKIPWGKKIAKNGGETKMPKTETKICPPSISSSLARRDYHWIEITPEEFGEMLAEKLKKMNAKVWMMDVYCSNDAVFRNLDVKWRSGTSVETITVHFNRDEGTTLDIRTES